MSEGDENGTLHKKKKVSDDSTIQSDRGKSIDKVVLENGNMKSNHVPVPTAKDAGSEVEEISTMETESSSKQPDAFPDPMAENGRLGPKFLKRYENELIFVPQPLLVAETVNSWTTLSYEKLLERKWEVANYELSIVVRYPHLKSVIPHCMPQDNAKDDNFCTWLYAMVESPVRYEYRNSCTFKIEVDEATKKCILRYCHCTKFLEKGNSCSYCANELPKNFIEISELFQAYLQKSQSNLEKTFWHQLTLRSSQSGEVMVIAQPATNNVSQQVEMAQKQGLKRFFEQKEGKDRNVTSVYLLSFVNGVATTKLLGGNSHLREDLGDKKFEISPLSYFVPCTQTAELYFNVIEDLVQPNKNMTLLDIGCGAGAFSIMVADKCKQVFGFDVAAPAVMDAMTNAEKNGARNCQFFCALSSNIEAILESKLKKEDKEVVAVIHPDCPLNVKTIRRIYSIRKVVYIASEPHILKKVGREYTRRPRPNDQVLILLKAVPVDMYPLALHSFVVGYFERRLWTGTQKTLLQVAAASHTNKELASSDNTKPKACNMQPSKGKSKDTKDVQATVHVQTKPVQNKPHQFLPLPPPCYNSPFRDVHPMYMMNMPGPGMVVNLEDEIADKLLCILDYELVKSRNVVRNKVHQLCYKLDQIDWSKILMDELGIVADAVFTRLSLEYPVIGRGRRYLEWKQKEAERKESEEKESQLLRSAESASKMQRLIDERVKNILVQSGLTEFSKLLQSINSQPILSGSSQPVATCHPGASHARQKSSTTVNQEPRGNKHSEYASCSDNRPNEQFPSDCSRLQSEVNLTTEKIKYYLTRIGLAPEDVRFYQSCIPMASTSSPREPVNLNLSMVSQNRLGDRYNGQCSVDAIDNRGYLSSNAPPQDRLQMHTVSDQPSRNQFQNSFARFNTEPEHSRRESFANFQA